MKLDTLELYKKYKSSVHKDKIKVLVHACCAPCSTEVLEELNAFSEIKIYYYNPNIYPFEEYLKRKEEFKKLPSKFDFIDGIYDESIFLDYTINESNMKEGSKRCYNCYKFRLRETARLAKELGYDFFTTTLSISPYKKSKWINEILEQCQKEYGVDYIYSDFKKNDGYKKSILYSKQYDLYRQEYCGCRYSKKEKEEHDLLKSINDE